ncbi:MAG: putative caspase-like protein [Gammaproteobacteria bacterium]
MLKLLFISLTLTGLFASFAATAEARFALIIGNSVYQQAAELANPVNDARDIETVLSELEFETRLLQDASLSDIEQGIKLFLNDLDTSDGVGLFFYAGHGIQINGDNYLLPVETRTDIDLAAQGYNVSQLLNAMRQSSTNTKIIILDACRNNPFIAQAAESGDSNGETRALVNKTLRNSATGLSKLDAPPDTLIAFSTSPGKTAADGNGRNSPYTGELLKTLQRRGLTIEKVFRTVRQGVYDKTDGKQIPWESSSLIKSFYFNPRKSIPMGF